MSEEKTCTRCGTRLEADRPEGLCPRCLMALNLAPQTEAPTGEVGPEGTKVVPPPPEPPPLVSDIAQHFPQLEILECLGRGGMGVVYKARQPKLDRLVALKILAREKAGEARFAERFQREARALARLNHPNIVAVFDFGETGGLYYLLMEFVDGVNLRQLIRSGTVRPEQALSIVPPICEALQYAHQQGIVHRDIKPENILVDKLGKVKIADFGIAKMLGTTGPAEPLTGEQQAVGTPHYMAPEQLEKPQAVDHRADIYSLGVVFYEMLTGELPLGKFQPPSRKVQVDVRLDEVVLHALEKEPELRYQQASQIKTDVETIVKDEAHGTKSQPGQGGATPPPGGLSGAATAWDQVKGPGTGLVVAGILNWVLTPLYLGVLSLMSPGRRHEAVVLGLLAGLLIGGTLFAAGLLMKRLTAWWLAVGAGILAILSAPGNLIGLPLGIWALVVLSRREVRQAFDRGYPLPAPTATPRSGGWKIAAVVGGTALLVAALVVTGFVLAIVLPAYSRSKARVQAAMPRNPAIPGSVQGIVTDAVTGRPIPGAMVTVRRAGVRAAQLMVSRATARKGGSFFVPLLRGGTNILQVSASGYEPQQVIVAVPAGSGGPHFLQRNIQLQPATNALAEASAAELEPPTPGQAPNPPKPPQAASVPKPAPAQPDVQLGSEAWKRGDYAQALELLLPAAEQGDPVAQHRLGVMFVRGDGVRRDFAEATYWFRQAAEQGQGEAQYSMGLRYLDGQGVPRDDQEAARWFRRSAEQGVGFAASRLAQLYFTGRGVPQDYAEAYKWLKIAGKEAEQGIVTFTLHDLRRKLSEEELARAEQGASEFVPRRLAPADP